MPWQRILCNGVMVEECNVLVNSDISVVGKCIMFETINNLGFSVLLHLLQFVGSCMTHISQQLAK
jgi:hypothetical protein